jgi:hypothetical protein
VLRANQDLRMTVVCCVLASMLCARAASAAVIFLDDFNDRNAQDGSPATWAPGLGTWDASSGDYVATGSLPRVSLVPAHVLGDTSARAQVRVTGTIGASIALRRTEPRIGYAGGIRADGTIEIARIDGAAAPVILGTSVVPFNPAAQDVLLQFDAFGNKLSVWAWRAGDSMPSERQVVAFDNTYAQGQPGLVSSSFAAGASDSSTFRFVQVADTHVPEPTSFVLMSLAGCGLLCARRRKRSSHRPRGRS